MKLEYKTLKEKVKEINKKDAKFYGNMFSKMTKLDSLDINVSIPSLLTHCAFSLLDGAYNFKLKAKRFKLLSLYLIFYIGIICRNRRQRMLSP